MKSKTTSVKNSEIIERRFRLLNLLNSVLIFLAIPCILLILFFILKDFQYFNSRISLFYPLIHLLLFAAKYIILLFLGEELLKDVKSKKIGRYNKNKIVKLCDKIIKENFEDNEEIPSIYLVKDLGYNAFAINSLFLNFIKGFNSIAISRELFDHLKIDELKAIIAHEIGHFKKYISITDRAPFIPLLFSVLSAYISTAFLAPVLDVPAIILYLICFIIIKTIISRPFKIFRKDVEFLSDLYAANKYGKLHTVNALIKLYQMSNMDIILYFEISKFMIKSKHMRIEDIQKIKKKIRRSLNKKTYDEELIKGQIVKCLEKIEATSNRKLSENEIKQRNKALKEYTKSISKMLENKVVNWDDIDNHVKDARIDSVEYENLIKILKEHPELQLFRTPNENVKKMKFETHPALRERILFVDKNVLSLAE